MAAKTANYELVDIDGTKTPLTEQQFRAFKALLNLDWGEGTAAVEFDSSQRVTTGQAAEILGVSRRTVTRMVDRGELPAVRAGEGRHRYLDLQDVVAKKLAAEQSRQRVRESIAQSEKDYAEGNYGDVEELVAKMEAMLSARRRVVKAV